MPPKGNRQAVGNGQESLKGLAPSNEELKAAREFLAKLDQKKMRSAHGCFTTWAKANGAAHLADSKGEDRQGWLVLYHVYQSRNKAAKKTTVTAHVESHSREDANDFVWLTKDGIIREKGQAIWDLWFESGELMKPGNFAPDAVTGSTKPEHCEFKVRMRSQLNRDKDDKSKRHEAATDGIDAEDIVTPVFGPPPGPRNSTDTPPLADAPA